MSQIKQRIQTITALSNLIYQTAEIAELDTAKTKARINVAKSINSKLYGKIPALVNLLASTVLFPAYSENEYSLVQARKEEIAKLPFYSEELETVLEYVKDSRGSTSFLNQDDLEIIEGRSPDVDEYREVVEYALSLLELPTDSIDFRLTSELWEKENERAIKKAKEQLASLQEELDKLDL